jgi:hypothetical protein
MSMRVLATPEAVEQIGHMQRVVEGGLATELRSLDGAARRLAQPDVWDGPHAVEFRRLWDEIGPRLEQARGDLTTLQQRVRAITGEILSAGGASG